MRSALAPGRERCGATIQAYGATGITHHPDGAVAGYTLGNGIAHSLTQNVRGLPLLARDAGVVQDRYAYDANGNVSSITDEQEGVSSRSMGYDGLDRLTVANGIWGAGGFGYDALDNLRTSTVGARTLSHQIDANNRLASLSGSQSIGLTYDANGNLTRRGSQDFVFDIANRLGSAPGKASYAYDGHGRRTAAWHADGSSRLQVYGRAGPILYASHSAQGVTRYVYLGHKLIAEVNSLTGTTFSHTDALGSPVARTSAGPNPSILSRTRYEPYGATAAGTNPTGIGFTGHVNDVDIGLVYMQQRYYDPFAGRFLSVDPVTTDGKTGDHFNRYAYADKNPYKFVDPDGRNPVIAAIVRVLLAIGGKEAAKSGPREGAKGAARAEGAAGKSHTTYTREKSEGTVYSGKTSGKGTAEEQVANRTSKPDHKAKTDEGYGPASVDKNSTNSDAIRGREQQLIESNGGAQSQGGISGNKINGVSPENPKAPVYQEAAKKEFGTK